VQHADASQVLESDSDAMARNFKQLCDDLTPGGPDAYLIYRAMSMDSHPSLMIADHWIEPPAEFGGPGILRTTPRPVESDDTWMYLVAASLVWGCRALDYFDREHKRRRILRRMAKEVGCAETLLLSDRYWKRVAKPRRLRPAVATPGPKGPRG